MRDLYKLFMRIFVFRIIDIGLSFEGKMEKLVQF